LVLVTQHQRAPSGGLTTACCVLPHGLVVPGGLATHA
jgi:hypothetical protein